MIILPLTSNHDVILAKQFRPGPNKVLPELPGGHCNPGESPLQAAERELAEETGYTGLLHHVATSDIEAYTIGTIHHFVASDCHLTQEQDLDATEFIQVVKVSLDDFIQLVRKCQLTEVRTAFLGLDYLGLL